MREDGEWEDGDHLMKCTGDVFTIHYHRITEQGWIEHWSHSTGAAVKVFAGATMSLNTYWTKLRNTCFVPTNEHLEMAGYPAGMR